MFLVATKEKRKRSKETKEGQGQGQGGEELVRNLITAPKTLMSNDGWNRWMDGLANKVN